MTEDADGYARDLAVRTDRSLRHWLHDSIIAGQRLTSVKVLEFAEWVLSRDGDDGALAAGVRFSALHGRFVSIQTAAVLADEIRRMLPLTGEWERDGDDFIRTGVV